MTKLMYLGIQLSLRNARALDQASTDAKTEWIAALIPNEKCLILLNQNNYRALKNSAGYHSEPVTPSTILILG